ncbi:hypothetical protein J7T55_010869 [Diaporthe amygdali]|uniref:uncharacterized protein n=1 Tax=Phomopsis amygdali TaxID=1214568 RepID=UPI0022FF271E|nr:uncharacterized protein J7T55_010869 [Diaporthe amygdali]KAJ0104405.1 hypothetical protein J7T55_010869 [Diaporthe amygdali]
MSTQRLKRLTPTMIFIHIQKAHSSSRSPSNDSNDNGGRGRRITRPETSQDFSYPPAFEVSLTIFALLIAVLCVALDSMIVSTAIPGIPDKCFDPHYVGWNGFGQLPSFLESTQKGEAN